MGLSGCAIEGVAAAPVCAQDDDECRELAQEIERQRPGWLVLWGIYSKRFVAFPLFPVRRRTILVVSYPEALLARMDEVERVSRVDPDTRG